MVESKVFSTDLNNDDLSPPIVQVVQADEPLDLWHLQAVPVVEPSAPLQVYDQAHSSSNLHNNEPPVSPITTTEASPFDEPGHTMDFDGDDPARKVAVGAGVASGVLGLLLGGPLLGLILGFGAAYATQRDDEWGDAACAVGHVALTAQEQARVVNQKHDIVERSKRAAGRAWKRAQEMDRKHHVLDKATEVLRSSWEAVRAFVHRHRLMERGMEGLGKALVWVIEQMQQKISQESPNGRVVEPEDRTSPNRP